MYPGRIHLTDLPTSTAFQISVTLGSTNVIGLFEPHYNGIVALRIHLPTLHVHTLLYLDVVPLRQNNGDDNNSNT